MKISYNYQGFIFDITVMPEKNTHTITFISYPASMPEKPPQEFLTHELQEVILTGPIENDIEEFFFEDWVHKILFHHELKNSLVPTPPWAKPL